MPTGIKVGDQCFQYRASLRFIPDTGINRLPVRRCCIILVSFSADLGQRNDFDHIAFDIGVLIQCHIGVIKLVNAKHTDSAGTAIADQLLRLLFTPLEGGLRISGAQICQNTMVGVAHQKVIGVGAAQVRNLKTSCLDAFCMELSGALLTLATPLGLLHIGEKQDQNYPQSPESENAQQQPDLPGPAHESHNCDDRTNQDRDAATQKSSVIIHV